MESEFPKKYEPQLVKWFRNALVVHLVDFPIYYIECLSERHFIVAGGGGSSKTGVHNQINLLELVPTFNYGVSSGCAANLVMKYNTPEEIPDAIMTGSLMKNMPIVDTRLITGGSKPAIYSISFDAIRKCFHIADHEILSDDQNLAKLDEVKTVKCIPGKVLTGGIDGQLAMWKLDGRQKRIERIITAHQKEIDEIDVDLNGQRIVTLSRDENKCCVWNLETLELIREFKRDLIYTEASSKTKYSYRSCRYACPKLDSKKRDSFLLVACNPIPKTGFSKILKWDTRNYDKFTSKITTVDGIMAMTVDLDGKYLAVGTRSGSVLVYEVANLNRIYKFDEAHHNAVTNLEFLHPKPESFSLTNSYTCPLISVSIDRRIIVHRPKKRRNIFLTFIFMLCIKLFLLVIYELYKKGYFS